MKAMHAILCFLPFAWTVSTWSDTVRPNVLLLVADDLGYGDIGVYGCKDIPTPNIDGLARDGIRFTDGYVSAPVCSPCRAGIMTGRYQTRFGHELNLPGADKYPGGMPQSERTMANYFRDAGYATGHVGKWHLGNSHLPGYGAQDRGFTESIWYPGQKKLPPLTKYRNMQSDKDDAYINDAMARDAAEFIGRHRQEPWFLYVPFLAVHEPLDVPTDLEQKFNQLKPPKRRKMAALLWSMDQAVGSILAALRQTRLEEQTLVVFLSDNGSYPKSSGSNGPLRGSKSNLFEGGIRVPFIMQWKSVLPAGAVYSQPVIALDLLPTGLAAAGVPAKPEWKLDGVNLLPYLQGEKSGPPHQTLYWRFGEQMAVRAGDWKLVRAREDKGQVPPSPALYHLSEDIGETQDLATQKPETVRQLQSLWDRWNAQQVKPLWGVSETSVP